MTTGDDDDDDDDDDNDYDDVKVLAKRGECVSRRAALS